MLKHRKYTRGIYMYTVAAWLCRHQRPIKLSENMSSSAYKPNTWHLSVFIDIKYLKWGHLYTMGYHYLLVYNDYQFFLLVTWHHPTPSYTYSTRHDSSMQKLKILPSHNMYFNHIYHVQSAESNSYTLCRMMIITSMYIVLSQECIRTRVRVSKNV